MTPTSAPLPSQSVLSSAEKAIWIGQMLRRDEPMYNMALQVTIQGELSVKRFAAALDSVIERSDSLRTTFADSGGLSRRQILDSLQPALECLDFSGRGDPESAAHQWCHNRAARLFTLSEKLIDFVLIRTGRERHVWFINNHHLITDATSMANIVREVGLAYARRLDNLSPGAEPALPQYADFLARQVENCQQAQFHQAASYWREKNQNLICAAPPPIEFYGPLPKTVRTTSKRFERRLSARRYERLRELAQDPEVRALTHNMTVHNILIAALAALLHRLSGRSELVIGTPAANRPTQALKEMIGLLVELHPLQLQIDEDENFVSLLKKAREQSNGLLMNAQSGAGQTEALGSFNVVLNFINAKIEFPGFKTSTQWLHPDSGDPNHHLRLEVHDFDGTNEPVLLFDLNQDVFSADAGNWLIEHFFQTLDTMLERPGSRLQQMDLLTRREPAAPQRLSPRQAHTDQTIVSLFLERVAASPESIALCTDEQSITYGKLLDLATALANDPSFRQYAGRGEIVAILGNRNAETIVSILAALMNGAAYLPVDPAYPDQRISLILDDARPGLILGSDEQRPRLASFGLPCLSVNLDELPASPDQTTADRLVEPTDLAYVLYTSGTTGTPNGVLVEHRNVVSLIDALHRGVYPASERALNVALIAPFVFDASVQQVFSALLGGHCLHIAPEKARLNGGLLREFFALREIDLSDGTPAHLGLIGDTVNRSALPLPQRLVLGGDRMSRAQLTAFYRSVHPQRPEIINIYGVAECTVDSTSYSIDPDTLDDLPELVPIGKPLYGSEIIIVSDGGKQQPTGVAGQILIAGPGVSRGYLNRSELTGAKFVRHPLRPNERAYLTGDLGRIDNSGNIHFLGRRDGQIKSRGIRIESGEIEHHLLTFQSEANSSVNIKPAFRDPASAPQRCHTCLLTSAHPQVSFNNDGICNVCEDWSNYAQASHDYFQTIGDFKRLQARAAKGREAADYDCMLLYSGGKDSSYVLHRLVELGLKVLAFTFDNGFISNAAFDNIRRQTAYLGVDSIVEKASAMDEIFVESLLTDATVCSGCFRALTAISTRLAHEKNINMVVTGLSRGQIFDTKLAGLYRQGIVEVEQVEENLRLFRKVFHANDDRTAQLLAVDLKTVAIDQIHFVDFFRYDNVGVGEVKDYLRAKDDYWSQPQDTGFCSSNCVMNDVGICVHNSQKGFHNYEAPLSWDVRLGVSLREEVLPEVTGPINTKSSEKILQRIGFFSKKVQAARVIGSDSVDATDHLTAYFQATQVIAPEELRTYLSQRLPNYLVPSRFIQVTQMPYTPHGKVDDRALRAFGLNNEQSDVYQAPATAVEEQLARIWAQVLGVEKIGVNDNFFDLGGDSISAIQIVGRANSIGLNLEAPQLLERQTIAKLATVDMKRLRASQEAVSGPVSLTPVLKWFLSHTEPTAIQRFSQVVSVKLPAGIDGLTLTKALRAVIDHHDALRLVFTNNPQGWQASNRLALVNYPEVTVIESAGPDDAQREQIITTMAEALNVSEPILIQACVLAEPDSCELLMVGNHLAVDAISWSVLLEDLESAYRQISAGRSLALPDKTHSFQDWANALLAYARSASLETEIRFWRAQERPDATVSPVPTSPDNQDTVRNLARHATFLNDAKTADLLRIAAQTKRPVQELMLAALSLAIGKTTGQRNIRIDVEGHGRESFESAPDVSRTVGWFTSIYPLTVSLVKNNPQRTDCFTDLQALNTISDQIRAIPDNGFSYGVLQYLVPGHGLMPQVDSPVLFNFLGQTRAENPSSASNWQIGNLRLFRSPDMMRRHSLEVTASVARGSLTIEWVFTSGSRQLAAVEALASNFQAILQEITTLLGNPDNQRSAAHFPQAKLNSKSMNKLAAALGKADARGAKMSTR